MQPPDHFERERAPSIEHLVHAVPTADEGNEVARLQPILIHMVLDRLHRVGKIHRIMLPLPRLHQRDKHVEAITLRCVALRDHQALDLFEDLAVITLALDWRNVHDFYLQTVCASIPSYCRCVPINRIYTGAPFADALT